jgi:hypothetical protein
MLHCLDYIFHLHLILFGKKNPGPNEVFLASSSTIPPHLKV